ncbi:MAG: ABC transporter permease [Clostridiales bacterium]|nr:ABC transporter permease [Clostridiales bacterium]
MIKDTLSMFWWYSKTSLNSRLQYKFDAILTTIALFLGQATSIVVVYFTLLKFDNINGWNINEMVFLFSLLFLTYGIFVIFFAGLRDFKYRIIDGAFDRMIIRPRGVLFQLMSINSDWLAACGHGSLGVILFIVSAHNLGIEWNIQTVLYYILAVIGGVLVQAAIFLFICSLKFFFGETDNLRWLLYGNMKKFAGYPISIFSKGIQMILIYVVPFSFVNYFPAQFFLRKEDMQGFPEVYMYIAPLVGIFLYLISYFFWRFSIKFYKSTGN